MIPAPAILRRLATARAGATAVEFAMVLPVLLMLTLGTAEVGRAFWMQAALNFAVQEAARCAVIQTTAPAGQTAACDTAADTAAYAANRVPQLKLPSADFVVNTAAACGAQVTAAVPYRFLMLPILPGAPTLHAEACHA